MNEHRDAAIRPPEEALAALLSALWQATVAQDGRAWSLAKLSKRSGMPMSAMRRQLSALVAAGLATMVLNEDGTGSAALTAAGLQACEGADIAGGDEAGAAGEPEEQRLPGR
jgi:DNA-binding transcriptional ArsR family regulator